MYNASPLDTIFNKTLIETSNSSIRKRQAAPQHRNQPLTLLKIAASPGAKQRSTEPEIIFLKNKRSFEGLTRLLNITLKSVHFIFHSKLLFERDRKDNVLHFIYIMYCHI